MNARTKLREALAALSNPLHLKSKYQDLMYWERLQKEMVDEVDHINQLGKRFVHGSRRPVFTSDLVKGDTQITQTDLLIDGQQVMQAWQKRFMRTVVRAADPAGKRVLEIGYGLGIASAEIQNLGASEHTIIECNPQVFDKMETWAQKHRARGARIRTMFGKWQDILPKLGTYQSILFDPYPFDESEFQQCWYDDANFDAHFFPYAAEHLTKNGTFSYFTNEIDSLSRLHQRQLLELFSKIEIEVVRDLVPPEDCQYWWAPDMTVVRATK